MEIFEEQNALWVLEDTDIYKYRLIELWQNNILLSYTESDIVCISAEVSLFRLCYNLIYKNKNKEKETVAMRYIEERCFDMKEIKRTISVD